MRFTKEQRYQLGVTGISGLVGAGLFTVVGNGIGHDIGNELASRYAKENGCELAWQTWHALQSGNATEVCGEVCATVCEAASDILCGTIPKFMIGFGVGAGALGLITLVGVGVKMCLDNQKESEHQGLIQPAV